MATQLGWRRMQILVSPQQYRALRAAASKRRMSMSEVVREALSKQLDLPSIEERLAAVERLSKLNAPVADWEQMEREIEEGRFKGCDAFLP